MIKVFMEPVDAKTCYHINLENSVDIYIQIKYNPATY